MTLTKSIFSFLFILFGIFIAMRIPNNIIIQNVGGMLVGSGVTLFLQIALPYVIDLDREYGYTLIPFSTLYNHQNEINHDPFIEQNYI